MIETQKFLKKHKNINLLNTHYGIDIKEYDDFYLLNYNQINSSKHRFNPIVIECRNLILRKIDFAILHRSFCRFFNYGEDPNSHNFNISNAIAYEKMDGSLIGIWHDGFKWHACTRKLAFAEGSTALGTTFRDIIYQALDLDVHNFAIKNNFDKSHSYIFELVSPETRVVKPYNHTALYALAVRNKVTGEYNNKELNRIWNINQIRKPQIFKFNSLDDILHASKNMQSEFDEGFVCDNNGWRIKIKNPSYLAIAHMRNNGVLSIPRVVQLVFDQDYEEYLTLFPEDKKVFDPYINAHKKFMDDVQYIFDLYKDFDRKKFATTVKDLSYSGVLFMLYDGKNLDEALNKMNSDSRIRILQSYFKDKK